MSGWTTLASPLAPLTSVTPNAEVPELHEGSKGDQVLWMQEHLASAVPTQETTGVFGAQTLANLEAFQTAHGIAASGIAEAATWAALLALAPVAVEWTGASRAQRLTPPRGLSPTVAPDGGSARSARPSARRCWPRLGNLTPARDDGDDLREDGLGATALQAGHASATARRSATVNPSRLPLIDIWWLSSQRLPGFQAQMTS